MLSRPVIDPSKSRAKPVRILPGPTLSARSKRRQAPSLPGASLNLAFSSALMRPFAATVLEASPGAIGIVLAGQRKTRTGSVSPRPYNQPKSSPWRRVWRRLDPSGGKFTLFPSLVATPLHRIAQEIAGKHGRSATANSPVASERHAPNVGNRFRLARNSRLTGELKSIGPLKIIRVAYGPRKGAAPAQRSM